MQTEEDRLRFVKIHAPFDVLSKYAQSLKLKMPIRRVRVHLYVNTITQ